MHKLSYKRCSRNITAAIYFILILSALFFSIWKLPLGLNGNDEAFYLTIPLRLVQGDTLLLNEWHVSQLSSLLMAPFVFLYTHLSGGTEGIILAARWLYLICHLAVSMFVFIKLRGKGAFAAAASLLYFIFTPYDIMAPSYNTMGLDLVTLTAVLMYSSKKTVHLIFPGMCFALAVLCNPYLIAAYILLVLCVLLQFYFNKSGQETPLSSSPCFCAGGLLFFTIGAAVPAIILLIHVFTAVGIMDLPVLLSGILADPEHSNTSILSKLFIYFESIYNASPFSRIGLIFYLILILLVLLDKMRMQHRIFYFLCTSADVFMFLLSYMPSLLEYHYNSIMFPMVFLGITSFILLEKKDWQLFAFIFIPGIIYSLCMVISSNQKFYVSAMAMASANIGSALFAAAFLRELINCEFKSPRAVSKLCSLLCLFAAVVLFLFQGGAEIKAKSGHIFGGGTVEEMNIKLSSGPDKGIYVNKDYHGSYSDLISQVQQDYSNKNGSILFLSRKSILYLCCPKLNSAAFSAWPSGEDELVLERLNDYYKINPDKIPDYIYLPLSSEYNIETIYESAVSHGYICRETELSLEFEKISRS